MGVETYRRMTPEARELEAKQAELAAREAELAQRELDLATLRAELEAFEQRYLCTVGVRYAELDEVQAQLAERQAQAHPDDATVQTEAVQARRQAGQSSMVAGRAAPEARAFTPTDALKRLYREVAKAMHPDLATDDAERARRQQLMTAANLAYAAGDLPRLQAILLEWESTPEAVPGDGPGAELVRAIRKLAQAMRRVDELEADLARLRTSDVYQLKVRVDAAEARGIDLLANMVTLIESKIQRLRAQLILEVPTDV